MKKFHGVKMTIELPQTGTPLKNKPASKSLIPVLDFIFNAYEGSFAIDNTDKLGKLNSAWIKSYGSVFSKEITKEVKNKIEFVSYLRVRLNKDCTKIKDASWFQEEKHPNGNYHTTSTSEKINYDEINNLLNQRKLNNTIKKSKISTANKKLKI